MCLCDYPVDSAPNSVSLLTGENTKHTLSMSQYRYQQLKRNTTLNTEHWTRWLQIAPDTVQVVSWCEHCLFFSLDKVCSICIGSRAATGREHQCKSVANVSLNTCKSHHVFSRTNIVHVEWNHHTVVDLPLCFFKPNYHECSWLAVAACKAFVWISCVDNLLVI